MTAESIDPASLHVLEVAGNAIVGGMERHVQMLAEGLLGRGHKVSALCPFESSFTAALRASGCRVHIAMLEEAMEWRALLTAAEVVRRQQVDVVHTHLFNATLLGSLAGALTGVPVAVTVHGMSVASEEMALVRLTGSHLITVCTAAYTMGLALGLPEDQISLIPNGVDTRRFHPGAGGRAFREELGVPEGVPLVGMVARLSREKGPDLFLQVVAQVAGVRTDAHFVLVGDGPLYSELARETQTLGLSGRLHLAGLVADTSAIYPALDVVCLPSRIEGQPLTLLEAMAAARPVVAMAVGGIPELVQMGETGWLVAQADATAMGERVLWLLEHPDRARQMGEASRRRALESFDVRAQAAAISGLFYRLVDSRRHLRRAYRLGRVYGQARVS
jgi:glycosyltransferase involved in cell wall biosynthesis